MKGTGEETQKWKGKASARLVGTKPDQVWPLLEDFFGLGKWFPTLATCMGIEGISGKPGCVRYCAGFRTPVDEYYFSMDKERKVNWTKQKLLAINPDDMSFIYSIVDGNVGFESYISKVRVVPEKEGCSIEWGYEVEPVKGWRPEDLEGFIGSGLQVMAKRMAEVIAHAD